MQKRIFNFLIIITLSVIFVTPLFFRPKILTGDEPHYLIAIQSVINDHDLNLTNNYKSITENEEIYFKDLLTVLDHHSVFVKKNAETIRWWFNLDTDKLVGYKERPEHSVIFILLYSLFTFPLAPFFGIALGSLLISHLFAVISFLLFYLIAKKYLKVKIAQAATIFLIFGTSFWFYANTVYSEIFLAFLLLLSFYLYSKWGDQKKIRLSRNRSY